MWCSYTQDFLPEGQRGHLSAHDRSQEFLHRLLYEGEASLIEFTTGLCMSEGRHLSNGCFAILGPPMVVDGSIGHPGELLEQRGPRLYFHASVSRQSSSQDSAPGGDKHIIIGPYGLHNLLDEVSDQQLQSGSQLILSCAHSIRDLLGKSRG